MVVQVLVEVQVLVDPVEVVVFFVALQLTVVPPLVPLHDQL